MSERRGVVLQVAKDAYRKQRGGSRARLVDCDDLEALQDDLARFGPEPVGFVLEMSDRGLEAVPAEWSVRSRWWTGGDSLDELPIELRGEDITGPPDVDLSRRPSTWESRLVIPTLTGDYTLVRRGDTIPEALRALALAAERLEALDGGGRRV